MKYGVSFSLIAVLLVVYAATGGGWFWLLLWPAVSFGVVASAYCGLGPRVFGKRPSGTLGAISVAILLPYLLYLWAIWHVMRLLSREPPFNTLRSGGVLIGRRLLPSELPSNVHTVVDLTCEFAEPGGIRGNCRYISCPILDASSIDPHTLADLARDVASIDDVVFVHCAQGHGRTGLVAALILIAANEANSVDDALAAVISARPLVGLSGRQLAVLHQAAELIANESSYDQ